MLGLASRMLPYLAVLAVAAAIWFHGQYTGMAICEGEHAERLAEAHARAADAARDAAAKEAARLAAEAERDRLAGELEDAAHADPVSAPGCLSHDRVRRLNQR